MKLNLCSRSILAWVFRRGASGVAAGFLVGAGLAVSAVRASEPAFFEVEDPAAGSTGTGSTVAGSRSRTVMLNSALRDQPSLWLNLFSDVAFEAQRTRFDLWANGDFAWVGRIEGEPMSEVVFASHGGVVSARVDRPLEDGNAVYAVAPVANGWSVVTELAPEVGAGGCDPAVAPLPPMAGEQLPPATAQNPAMVDVMVVYTPAAQAVVGGPAATIESQIVDAIASANTAYRNSGVYLTLPRLQQPGDGYMDEVPLWREQYLADLVVLLTPDTGLCGKAYVMTNSDTGFAPYAYAVVDPRCLANLSLTHEMGHLMGCQHDRAHAGGPGAYPYSYGYQWCVATLGFRTLMAYQCD